MKLLKMNHIKPDEKSTLVFLVEVSVFQNASSPHMPPVIDNPDFILASKPAIKELPFTNSL
jgi:hypothetical protein